MKIEVEIPDGLGRFCLSSNLGLECPFYEEDIETGSMFCRYLHEPIWYLDKTTKCALKIEGCPTVA